MRLVTVFFQYQYCSVSYVGFVMGPLSYLSTSEFILLVFLVSFTVYMLLMDCVIGSATDNLFVVKNKPKK